PPRCPRFPYTTLFRSLVGVDTEIGHRFDDGADVDAALVGKRFERGDDDRFAIDLEEMPQRFAAVAAAEAVGAERHVTTRHPLPRSEEHTSELQSRENR